MVARRIWLKAAVATLGATVTGRLALGQQGNGFSSERRGSPRGVASLKDQLTKGLRVISPQQQKFVAVVIAYVDSGRIPRSMVNAVFDWARERNSRLPFPYFQLALKILARRRGVILPNELPKNS